MTAALSTWSTMWVRRNSSPAAQVRPRMAERASTILISSGIRKACARSSRKVLWRQCYAELHPCTSWPPQAQSVRPLGCRTERSHMAASRIICREPKFWAPTGWRWPTGHNQRPSACPCPSFFWQSQSGGITDHAQFVNWFPADWRRSWSPCWLIVFGYGYLTLSLRFPKIAFSLYTIFVVYSKNY